MGAIVLAVVLMLGGCGLRCPAPDMTLVSDEEFPPCQMDFLDPRPECNEPDPCECEFPWNPEFDGCCRRLVEKMCLRRLP